MLVTTGPGGTNVLTPVAGAWIESVPLLVLSGQVKRADRIGASGVRQMGVQEVDIVRMVAPITKYAVTVDDPAHIRYHMEKAVHLARSGRQGPVWVDVPLDVQAAPIDPDALEGFTPDSVEPAAGYAERSRQPWHCCAKPSGRCSWPATGYVWLVPRKPFGSCTRPSRSQWSPPGTPLT